MPPPADKLQDDPAPRSADIYVGRVQMALQRRDPVGAASILRTGRKEHAFDPRLMGLERDVGLTLFSAGQWEAAAPVLARATRREPWDAQLKEAADRCQTPSYLDAVVDDPHLGRAQARYAPREGDTYIFVIDIVGTCNLRCPTCPVGNTPLGGRTIGFMAPEMFEQIVGKIRRESPVPRPRINLYNWGEPLLHPDLPDFIRLLRAQGMTSHLSTNLNIRRGLEATIEANPDEMKISLSGFSTKTYTKTHVRGDLDLLKENLTLLRTFMDRHRATTRVWVGQHLYRSNAHESEIVRQLCADLRFEYHPFQAYYMPLERVIDAIESDAPEKDAPILTDLFVTPRDHHRQVAPLKRRATYDCELRFNQTVINHDGRVALCCTVYEEDNMLGATFLDEPLEALTARKYKHPFCGKCMSLGLQYAPLDPEEEPAGAVAG